MSRTGASVGSRFGLPVEARRRVVVRLIDVGLVLSTLFIPPFLLRAKPEWTAVILALGVLLAHAAAAIAARKIDAARAMAVVMGLGLVVIPLLAGEAIITRQSPPALFLMILPMLAAILYPDVPLIVGGLGGFGTVASLVALSLTLGPSDALRYAPMAITLLGFSWYTAARHRRMLAMHAELAASETTRTTEMLVNAASGFLAHREEEAVLDAVVAALSQCQLEAKVLRSDGTKPSSAKDDGEAVLDVGIVVEGAPLARLFIHGRELTAASAAAIELFAQQIGLAIENVRHLRRAEARLEELHRLQADLVARERLAALGEAAAVVAHEVRNPLATLQNSISLLRRDRGLSTDGSALLAIQQEEVARLERLVSDLLVLARPLVPQLRPVPLQEICTRAVAGVEAEVASSGVSLAMEGTADVSVRGDQDHLHIAIVNLLRNALQATPRDGRVVLGWNASEGNVQLWVEDEGPGIAPEIAERIFEPFYTTRSAGTGLGLSIVRRVVQAHGGRIRVVPRDGGGARFEVVLPALT